MKFGDIIRARRKKKGFPQIELAKQAGISPSWVTKIEKGALPAPPIAWNLIDVIKTDEKDKEELLKVYNEEKNKRDAEISKKRSFVYHSPLSADDIEEIAEINKIFEEEIIKKRRLEEIGLAAAGPIKLDIKTKIEILKQLKILKGKKSKE